MRPIRGLCMYAVLAVLVVGAALSCRSRPAPGPGEAAAAAALDHVSRSLGIPPSKLEIVATATARFDHLGKRATTFKVRDVDGGMHGVAVTGSLGAVDPEKLFADERAARQQQLGTWDDALAHQIQGGGNAPIAVVVWLAEKAPFAATRPAFGGPALSADAVDALYAENRKARAAAVQQIVAPVLQRVRKLDAGARADGVSPAISARLTPEALRTLMRDADVARIYLDPPAHPSFTVPEMTAGIPDVHAQGIRGTGVKVADVEAGDAQVDQSSLLLRPVTQDPLHVCPSNLGPQPSTAHTMAVVGMIIERQLSFLPPPVGDDGFAPEASVRVGGSCFGRSDQIRELADRAADWGARAINLSFGSFSQIRPGATDRFFDDLVFYRYRTVAVAVGNGLCGGGGIVQSQSPINPKDGFVASPAIAYNTIGVGGYNDNNTARWDDDSVYECSSFRNPLSFHGDRQKPEIAAPAVKMVMVDVGPANFQTTDGTSYASPQVVAATALLIQKSAMFSIWPETVRATLMATAVHNIEGDTRLSDIDGAGGLVVNTAIDLAGAPNRTGGMRYACDTSTSQVLPLVTLSVASATHQRIVLSWDSDPAFDDYEDRPSADIDLCLVDANNQVIARSLSWDNTFEIVELDTPTGGTFTLQAVKYRCDRPSTWLGWAWLTTASALP